MYVHTQTGRIQKNIILTEQKQFADKTQYIIEEEYQQQ